MNTILVPLDGSPLADRVLPYVQLLAPVFRARVHLIRAISATEHDRLLMRSALVEARSWARSFRQYVLPVRMADMCQGTECAIAQQAACLRASGVEAYADTRVGTAAAVIATTAEQSPDTLIAMATHGHTGLRRWAFGSTADTLLHTTSIPLFLVRGDRCCTSAQFGNQAYTSAARRLGARASSTADSDRAGNLCAGGVTPASGRRTIDRGLSARLSGCDRSATAPPRAGGFRHLCIRRYDPAAVGAGFDSCCCRPHRPDDR